MGECSCEGRCKAEELGEGRLPGSWEGKREGDRDGGRERGREGTGCSLGSRRFYQEHVINMPWRPVWKGPQSHMSPPLEEMLQTSHRCQSSCIRPPMLQNSAHAVLQRCEKHLLSFKIENKSQETPSHRRGWTCDLSDWG